MQGAERLLLNAIARGRVPHAILVTGPEGSDAAGFVRRAAALYCLGKRGAAPDATQGGARDIALLGNCPDYIELNGGGVDDIREMQKALSVRAYQTNRAVALLSAHRMTEAAQNALLKILEEPPAHTMMLLEGAEAGLLQTIRSRCSTIRLGEMTEEAVYERLRAQGCDQNAARLAARHAGGAPKLAESMASREFQAFYAQAAKLLDTALMASSPPYAALAALLNMPAIPEADEGAKRSKTEQRRESGLFALRVWQVRMREMLHQSLGAGGAVVVQGQRGASQRGASQRFTTKEIQGIIELILSAERRIGVANPQLTMDALITALTVPAEDKDE